MAAARRVVISLLMLLVVAAIVWAVVGRPRRPTDAKSSAGVTPAREAGAPTPASTASIDTPTALQTSEDLIATALKAGRITYEQSLLARAYALYDDPRLPKEFRSPVIDWEAGTALFIEIDEKEAMLSNQALTDLAPFRARPNDPISIFNRPRAEVVKAQNRPATGWESRKVQGTNVRIWIKGTQADLDRFGPMVASVWSAYPGFFPYPINDAGGASSAINPDTAIDLYFMNGGDIDPRADICAGSGNGVRCRLGSHGTTWSTEPKGALSSSAYCLINLQHSDDEVLGTIAHELAHAAQMKYDYHEHDMPGSKWLTEGSATWVEHRVLKGLGKIPTGPYGHLENPEAIGMFDNLHRSLDDRYHWYGTWLFFNHASMDLGDGIVKTIWETASRQGLDGTAAVGRAVPFKDHFPRFAVRNWNKDPVPNQYKTRDRTFPPDLKPLFADLIEDPPLKKELLAPEEPLPHLATAYFPFKFPGRIRRVTVENMYWNLDDAHLWAIRRIGQDWQQPEDWSKDQQHTFCRDVMEEDLSELVLIVSNSNPANALPAHPRPRVLSEPVGCPVIEGWAHATLRVKDDTQDVTYDSGRVQLRFKARPRAANVPADVVEYDLLPGGMTWHAYGRVRNCTISGAAGVTFDGPGNDTSRLAWGYMKVTGVGAANDHGLLVPAGTMSTITQTCPPRQVIKDAPAANKLLVITSAPNTVEGGAVVFKGKQTYDIGDPLASVSPGFLEAMKVMPQMREALGNALKGRAVYTFEWELKPQNGTGAPPPDSHSR